MSAPQICQSFHGKRGRAGLVHSTGRVRFQTSDYSVPIQYAYQRLTLKADPFRVRLYAGEELVANHPRTYEKRHVIEDWQHYVPLLGRFCDDLFWYERAAEQLPRREVQIWDDLDLAALALLNDGLIICRDADRPDIASRDCRYT